MKITSILYAVLTLTAPLLHATNTHAQLLERRVTANYVDKSLYQVVVDLQSRTKVDFGFTDRLALDNVPFP